MNQDFCLRKPTTKAIELKCDDKCVVQNKIYRIAAIRIISTITLKKKLRNKLCFILYCDDDKSKKEKIFPADYLLTLNEDFIVIMDD